MRQTLAITRKELRSAFGSPMAIIFLGAFLVAVLFSFFWIDAFFARGTADVRPLFSRMPLLMIFLVATLTMRSWSEEQRSGTLEVLLTLPVRAVQLVAGKFLAVMALVILALALTLFLPLTVGLLGNLDWGPVFGGYLASVLLAAAYTAIGLCISSRTDNQIVALIATALLCGLFYVIGSTGVTDFVNATLAEVLGALGTGSRFASIERGVVDIRDMLYYLTLAGTFLALTVLSLESKRWSQGEAARPQRRALTLTTLLVVLNLVLANVWAYPLRGLRLDLTEDREYSLSQPTRELLQSLQEPLQIHAFLSESTHPLLAPLIPRLRDMLQEYALASDGRLQVTVVDPADDPEAEAEANQNYGIQPTPFQVEGRYEASIVNAYFDLLIRYGDQSAVLGFGDLIEVEALRNGSVNVRFRNLEYDLTSAIKKAVYGFQSVEAVLAALGQPAQLTVYVTPETLPEWLADAPATIEAVASDIAAKSGGKFSYSVVNPDAAGSPVTRQELYDTYGLQPLQVSFLSDQNYYLYMVLTAGDEAQVVYPATEFSEAEVRTALESALKRSSSGFLQVVGLWTPPEEPTQDVYGNAQEPLSTWNGLRQALTDEYEVRKLDLTTGQVGSDVDALVIVAPQAMSDRERFAIDQHLMRGGTVIVAAGNYGITYDYYSGWLGLQTLENGLGDMLASYGVTVELLLVLDEQNEPFPVVVDRQVGDMAVQEIQSIEYPFFVDVRSDAMASDSYIVSNLNTLTLNWVSPITLDEQKNAERSVVELLKSSPQAWTQSDLNIQPDFTLYPELGFPTGAGRAQYTLAVSVQGVFDSYFAGQPFPAADDSGANPEIGAEPEAVPPTIASSPATARLVVIGSSEFLNDTIFSLSSNLMGDRYLNSLKLLQNAVAWATEDLDLLGIRARGTSARLLPTLSEGGQRGWEIANYVFVLGALALVGIITAVRRRRERPLELLPREGAQPAAQEVEA